MTQTKNILDEVEALLSSMYEFRKNVVKDKIEYRPVGSKGHYTSVGDYFVNSLRRFIKSQGQKISKSELTGLLNSQFVPKVDVIKEYLDSLFTPYLTVGSEQTSAIERLAATVTTTNQPLWIKCLRKWLVATIACAIEPEAVNHQILILTGKQGIGKSRWFQRLLPPLLNDYMYSGHISVGNKDTLTMLSENLFINLDELGGFSASDIDGMKELITKSVIQFRRPYAIYTENYIRRASFMASVNHATFLNDLTGNRRFIPFTALSIDYQHTISMDEVYAEAYSLYKEGFRYWFDAGEIAEVEANNEQYVEVSLEQELIEKHFTPAEQESELAAAMTTTDISRYLHINEKMSYSNSSVQKVGATLRSLGFKRVKRQNKYKYIVQFKILEPKEA